MAGRIGQSGERPEIHELKKFVSPDINHKTEGKNKLALGRQVIKNIAKKVSAKFHRIANKLKTGEWINNASVAKKLTVNVCQLNVQAGALLQQKYYNKLIDDFLKTATSDAVAIEKLLKKIKSTDSLSTIETEIAELDGKLKSITKKPFNVDLSREINAAKAAEAKKVEEPKTKEKKILQHPSKVVRQRYNAVVNQIKQTGARKTEAKAEVREVEVPVAVPQTPIGKVEHLLQSFISFARNRHDFLNDEGYTIAKTYRTVNDGRVVEFKRLMHEGLVGDTLEDKVNRAEILLLFIDEELVREHLAQKRQGHVNVMPENADLKKKYTEMKAAVWPLIDEIRENSEGYETADDGSSWEYRSFEEQ